MSLKYKVIPVTHYQQNCSLIWCAETGYAAVVDPGGDLEKIVESIEREGVDVEKILLTHGHLDHVGATAELKSRLCVPVIGPHKEDKFWLDALPTQAQMMGFGSVECFNPTRWLRDGDKLELGNVSLEVIHCPGHTPGHVIFYHRESNFAIVGDVIFNGSIGRTDFPRGDMEQLLHSIRQKLFPLGDNVRFLPGHGPESTFGNERKYNPFVADRRFG